MKLDIPSGPIKTTPLIDLDTIDQTLNNNLKQANHTSLPKRKLGVTAIVARIRSGPEVRPKVKANENKYSKPKSPKRKNNPDLT